jgi:hypothetical protein
VTSFIVEAGIIGLPALSATMGVRSPTFSTTTLILDNGTWARARPAMTTGGSTVLTLTVGCFALMRACAGAAQANAAHAISRAAAPIGTRRAGFCRAARLLAAPGAVPLPCWIESERVDGAAVANETDEAVHGTRRRTRKDRKACVMNGRKTKESRLKHGARRAVLMWGIQGV